MTFLEFRTPLTVCPKCGYQMDAATSVTPGTPRAPKPGDFTVCMECAAALRFGPGCCLRAVTDEELVELALNQPGDFQVLTRAQNIAAEHAQQRKKRR